MAPVSCFILSVVSIVSVVSIIPRGHQYNASEYNASEYNASEYNASEYNASEYNASEGVVLSIPMNKFRGLPHERVKGQKYGSFERMQLGQTTASALKDAGLITVIPDHIDFPFSAYKVPKRTNLSKVDDLCRVSCHYDQWDCIE